jgi:methylmalonyl-CoA mutase
MHASPASRQRTPQCCSRVGRSWASKATWPPKYVYERARQGRSRVENYSARRSAAAHGPQGRPAPLHATGATCCSGCLTENVPGSVPVHRRRLPIEAHGEDPARMFAGEGPPERTNAALPPRSRGQPAARLSTAFDSVTLYGEDPHERPTSTARSASQA